MAQTPQDMQAAATDLARRLIETPDTIRVSQLRRLKQVNDAFHTMVKGEMDKMRNEVRSRAGGQALSQMQQGGGAA